VDAEERGKGIGRELVGAALREAAQRGVKTVDLTSHPSREAANHLYKQMGFTPRDSNVYRYSLS
jgi:ribosomal protein S18 acetylase RimI-like enzyme